MYAIIHAFTINGEIAIIQDDGAVYKLGREDDLSSRPLQWQELPPIPRSDREASGETTYTTPVAAARAVVAEGPTS